MFFSLLFWFLCCFCFSSSIHTYKRIYMYEPEHSILGSLAKRVVSVINTNPISQPEQNFRVLKGPFVSMRRFFFELLKHMFKSYDVDTQKNRLDEMVCLSTKNK